jgi:hypothetical protein
MIGDWTPVGWGVSSEVQQDVWMEELAMERIILRDGGPCEQVQIRLTPWVDPDRVAEIGFSPHEPHEMPET